MTSTSLVQPLILDILRESSGWNLLQFVQPSPATDGQKSGRRLLWQTELTGSDNRLLAAELFVQPEGSRHPFLVLDDDGRLFCGIVDTANPGASSIQQQHLDLKACRPAACFTPYDAGQTPEQFWFSGCFDLDVLKTLPTKSQPDLWQAFNLDQLQLEGRYDQDECDMVLGWRINTEAVLANADPGLLLEPIQAFQLPEFHDHKNMRVTAAGDAEQQILYLTDEELPAELQPSSDTLSDNSPDNNAASKTSGRRRRRRRRKEQKAIAFYRIDVQSGEQRIHLLRGPDSAICPELPDVFRPERVMTLGFSPQTASAPQTDSAPQTGAGPQHSDKPLPLAILPAPEATQTLHPATDEDEVRLAYAMRIINLNTLDVIWQGPVNALNQQESGCDDDEFELLCQHFDPLAAKTAANEDQPSANEEELGEALESFCEALSGSELTDGGRLFWLNWGKTLQKIDLQRLLASDQSKPADEFSHYYLLEKQTDTPEPADNPLNYVAYHRYDYQLQAVAGSASDNPNRLFFAMNINELLFDQMQPEPDTRTDNSVNNSANASKTWRVPYRELSKPELIIDAKGFVPKPANKILIEVDYLPLPESQLQGCQQLAAQFRLLGTSDTPLKGDRCQLLFTDRDGREADEEIFSQTALTGSAAAECAPLLAEVVECFIRSKNPQFLRAAENLPALSYTVKALAEYSDTYLPLVNQYLAVIDDDCPFFAIEELLPMIDRKYGQGLLKSRAYKRFIDGLIWPFNGKDC